jgi:hypothetical protein
MMLADPGAIAMTVPDAFTDARTVATGVGVMVTADVPALPSLVAVILAVPTATALTKPVELTVAFVASDVVHVMVRPVSVAPVA